MRKVLLTVAAAFLTTFGSAQAATFTEVTGTDLGGGTFSYDLHIQYGGLVTGMFDVGFGGNFTNRIAYGADPAGWTNNADPLTASWTYITSTLPQNVSSTFTATSSESGSKTGRIYVLFGFVYWFCHFGTPTLLNPVGYTSHYVPIPCPPDEDDGATSISSRVVMLDDPEISGMTSNTITFTWPTESTVSIQGSTNLSDWTHLAYALGYSNTTTWTSSFPLIASGTYFRTELAALCHNTNLAQRGGTATPAAEIHGIRQRGGVFAVDVATEADKPYAASMRRGDGSVALDRGSFTATGQVTTVEFPALDAREPLFFDARPITSAPSALSPLPSRARR